MPRRPKTRRRPRAPERRRRPAARYGRVESHSQGGQAIEDQPLLYRLASLVRNYFGDVRMLATDTGLMNRASRLVWKACKMDGRASRFRSEPHRSSHNAAA